jgi:hypothetical protein
MLGGCAEDTDGADGGGTAENLLLLPATTLLRWSDSLSDDHEVDGARNAVFVPELGTRPPARWSSLLALVSTIASAYIAFSRSRFSFSIATRLRSRSRASASNCAANDSCCLRWASSSSARLRRSCRRKFAFCSRFFLIRTRCKGAPSSPSSSTKRTTRFTAPFELDSSMGFAGALSGTGGRVKSEESFLSGDGVAV